MHEPIHELVEIAGPRGRLCGKLGYRMDDPATRCTSSGFGGVLVLSPHPFMGGHMDLPLLTKIADHLIAHAIPTLRFNYGGVGQSEGPRFDVGSAMDTFWKTGSAPQDPVLIDEARCALGWFSRQTNAPIILVGYSFGAFVATQIRDQNTPALGLVAPTITHHDYSGFSNEGIPTLVVTGEGDFATGDQEMSNWANSLGVDTRFEQISGGDHFFRGSSDRVGELIAEFVTHLRAAKEETSQ